jgi:predicted AlkP superfamily pyrophosphatase or phosphodiesterase
MKKLALLLALAFSLVAATPKKPKLVVAIVIDQFRYDYLTRFRSEYRDGFDRLLTKGAVFTNARYIHFPTVTAIGHSTILTGAPPAVSGIVGNEWYDFKEQKRVTSVSDRSTRLLGGSGEGSSPHRLLVSTVGDELKMADGRKSKVIGISLKDRAAILPSGHMANGAYWFDPATGNFVSSTYYFSDLPGWVKDFNSGQWAAKYRGLSWLNHKLPEDLKELYPALETSPVGNELVEQFAELALRAEQLGKHEVPDLLTVSFSSNDYVGHRYGTYSPEEHDITVKTDALLGKLFQAIDRQVGLDETLIILTGDHGVAPSAAEDETNHMPGGRQPAGLVRDAVQTALVKKYGEGNWILGNFDFSIYLNRDLIAAKGLDPAEVARTGAAAAMEVPHVARAYTRFQLAAGAFPNDDIARRVVNGFNLERAADIQFIPEPYWTFSGSTATHGTPFSYDSHVPIIFLGPGIQAGYYHGEVTVNDIAPTVATILEVETPSGSIGRVLTEMFVP